MKNLQHGLHMILEIPFFLEKAYQLYLSGQGPVEVDLGDEYKIHFKHWIQSSKTNLDKQRPIVRGRSEQIKFIVRKDRWESSNNFITQDNLFNAKHNNAMINPEEDRIKRKLTKQKNHFIFTWEVGNDNIELTLPNEMDFFKERRLKLKIESYITELKSELKQLSIEYEFQNKINPYEFSEVFTNLGKNPSTLDLYNTLAQMYIKETFLSF